ncbi:bifunctional folylpolyglutamate synthase/dihydrofolate synthase [Chitinophaga rhizosphaerae]|uniref:bifunctional folylpolyglutamate synthase/dihydrofolate synthase n=1 Tax=Chitinophaga rhizosphaerae TaxID=1864947 RepID=UPI000F809572|nr:folylpolyglutamate synthase/dihydrofolate synthase family protein [Chitinophaga rhizosphaerae]
MNYQQTIDYLYSRLPMFSKLGASALKNDLLNIRLLCGVLGHPEAKFPAVHIAGTNGKGSTSHMLSAIFQSAGYKTGLYTSPHLHDFRERIRINGEMIPGERVVTFTEAIKQHIETIDPSFFEVTVAMAFQWFADEGVDIAIIETGLGGRLDSTNIISPLLSIITNISLDHTHILGNTPELIAREKAGIIKPDTPVVISETQAGPEGVFREMADLHNAPILFADKQYTIIKSEPGPETLTVTVASGPGEPASTYRLDLPGHYQEKNLLGVLAGVSILRQEGYQLTQEAVEKGLANVKRLTGLGGRWEVIGRQPYTVLDVGHNEAGIRAILEQLALVKFEKLHIVTGFVKDKDVPAALRLFPQDAMYYFTRAQIPRALDEKELLEMASQEGLQGNAYTGVPEAYAAARAAAGANDMILVCGSCFIVGDMPLQP